MVEANADAVADPRTAQLVAWLLDPATRELDGAALFLGLIEALRAAGIELDRFSASVRTLHPEVFVDNFVWTAGEGLVRKVRTNSMLNHARYQASPVAQLYAGSEEIRVDLGDVEDAGRFPVTAELAEQGMLDYVALLLPGEHASFMSLASRTRRGFDRHMSLLRALVPALSLRVELASQRSVTASLLRTYLGPNAAQRVLAGAFRRGEGEPIDAVIWSCDLRGFTTMVDGASMAEVLPTLDRYFECVADPIAAHGGEVLKFIGDAVLGIFVAPPPGELSAASMPPCRASLLAVRDAFDALAKLNAERAEQGRAALNFGVALHVGTVTYGNIGATGRLDFTVIGRAVNEVTRVESLCKVLGRRLIVTETFARALAGGKAVAEARCGEEALVSLGRHPLRGVSHELELFTLDSLAPSLSGERGLPGGDAAARSDV